MQKSIFQNPWVLGATALLCNLLWGSAFPAVKTGYGLFAIEADDTAAQILFAGCRFFLAGLLVLSFRWASRKKPALPRRQDLRAIAVTGSVQTVAQYILFYVGLAHTTGVKGSILTASNVFFGILITCILYRTEKLTLGKVLGCGLGFFGVVLVNVSGRGTFSWNTAGDTAVVLSSAANAFAAVLIKRFSQKTDPVLLNGCQFLFGGAVMASGSFLLGGRFPAVSLYGAAVLLYLSLLSACAYTLWSVLLKYNPVTKVTIYCFTNPIFGVLLSAFILKENTAFGFRGTAALLLVCAGILLVNGVGIRRRERAA